MKAEHYKDIIFSQDQFQDQLEYWLKVIEKELKPMTLFREFKCYDNDKADPGLLKIKIEDELANKLLKLSKNSDLTLYIVLLTIFKALLFRYTWDEEILILSPPAKLNDNAKKPVQYNKSVLFRDRVETGLTVKELLLKTRHSTLAAYKNQDFPLDLAFKKRGLHINDFSFINSVIFMLGNIHAEEDIKDKKYDILFSFERNEKNLRGTITFNRQTIAREIVEEFANRYVRMIENGINNIDKRIKELDILVDSEFQQLLHDFNDTSGEFPRNKTIIKLFEEQVDKTPGNIAVSFNKEKLSYRELNERANRMANFLGKRGIGPDSIAAIMMHNSLELIIAILGTLKAGGSYLPISPGLPRQRILSILEDSGARILLTEDEVMKDFAFIPFQNFEKGDKQTLVPPPGRPQITDLDSIQIPDRSLIDYEKYRDFIGQSMVKNCITVQFSRGCIYKCLYCFKIWKNRYVLRSAENLFEEIRLYYKMGIRRFGFTDDLPNFNGKEFEKLLRLIIKNRLKLHLHFPNGLRGDILTKGQIDLMIEAGSVTIDFGLETASERLQKVLKKNVNLDKLRNNIQYIIDRYPHVILGVQIMHGFPTETEEEALASLNFIKSFRWLPFGYMHILKIYPNTDMEKFALENGVSKKQILKSFDLGYHELPETLPFSKMFTKNYQTMYLNDFFLLKERLLKVLPFQMSMLTEDELVQKYNSYLPVEIKNFSDLLHYTGICDKDLNGKCLPEDYGRVNDLNRKLKNYFPGVKYNKNPLKVLLLDLSQHFSGEGNDLYSVVDPPLGLLYLLTNLNRRFAGRISGKIAKSRIDFDDYNQLKKIIEEFKPDVIGIRTLNFFKDFFHKTLSLIRMWGIDKPIIAGGPYATNAYQTMLQDANIDVAVLGEGEITLVELLEKILDNNGKLPGDDVLKSIQGIAFLEQEDKISRKKSNREILLVDLLADHIAKEGNENLKINIQPANLAYTIYTSGSTGLPKGVMIQHKNLVNQILGLKKKFRLDASLNYISLASFTFDVSIMHLFLPIISGAELFVISDEMRKDPIKLWQFIFENNINILNIVPSYMKTLLEYIEKKKVHLKYLFVGGDIFEKELYGALADTFIVDKIINIYGPTETTINATLHECSDSKNYELIPIGKPLANYHAYIMDKDANLLPIGMKGELYISGDGVARGYLNREELSLERFRKNPFFKDKTIFKTGDFARWLPDGNIEFLGRIDRQVKIRGFRIELEEIESTLLKEGTIKEAVVIQKEEKNREKYLCAYIAANENVDTSKLRKYLSQKLPDYMVPSHFVKLQEMPLTFSGKIDRNSLPEPETVKIKGTYKAPRDKIEKKLLLLWSEVLGVNRDRIDIDSNFFELGGHSLKATILISKLHKEFNTKIPMIELFKKPNIAGLGELIKNSTTDKFEAIEKAADKRYYALSSAQKRMYVLQQMDLSDTKYNLAMVRVIQDNVIDKKRVNDTVKKLIDRHESLRTGFKMTAEKPVQVIRDNVAFSIDDYEASGKEARKIINDFVKPFDLTKAPLFRMGLIRIHEQRDILLIDIHHIICDGISQELLFEDFMALYSGKELPPLKLQYKDYSEWQNNNNVQEAIKRQEDYWIKKFTGEIPVLNLPIDYIRPAVQSFEGMCEEFEIGIEQTTALRKLAIGEDLTMYMLLLACYVVLLYKISVRQPEEIIIGTPIAGRRHSDLDRIIGMFVNTLALKNRIDAKNSFSSFLSDVKKETLASFENQEYQFEDLVNKIKLDRDPSRSPLFDVMFAMQNIDRNGEKKSPVDQPEPQHRYYEMEKRMSKFDMSFYGFDSGEKIYFAVEYCMKLFKKETILNVVGYFKRILTAVLNDKTIQVADIEIISNEERKKILYDFNDTDSDYPREKCIHELFENQSECRPGHLAVIYQDKQLTYDKLNETANRLAFALRKKGIDNTKITGIMVERSLEMMTGILGILKAGGAYLPIDPLYPGDRIHFMLDDSDAGVLLMQGKAAHEIQKKNKCEVLNLDDSRIFSKNVTNLAAINHPNDPVYAIYTSGSTGQPKGVLIEHRSLVNRLNWMQQQYPISKQDVILQKTPFTFDVSKWELFWWGLYGAKLCFLEPGGEKEPAALINAIEKEKVTVLHFVPTMLNAFLEYVEGNRLYRGLKCLKQVFASGEKLCLNHWHSFESLLNKRYGTKLANLYGPTEATVDVTYFDCDKTDRYQDIPIGKPIDNIKIYIYDKNLNLLPVGIPGELGISGVGLARGYIKRPVLTKEKFIVNPFETGARLYKTGDLARWLPDGNIEFLGRIDHQVKIRGFRIEIGEIENRLLKYEGIREVLILSKEDENKNKYLCAYIVTGEELQTAKIRKYLSGFLPDYMIPAHFIKLEKIPLTANGKIDRKTLLEQAIVTEGSGESPGNEVEETLTRIWQQVLAVDKIGVNDNFFELGGDSIKLIQVASRLLKYRLKFENKDLFLNPTIRQLAKCVEKTTHDVFQGVVTGKEKLIPIQEWFFENYSTDIHHFNQAVMLYRKNGFDEKILIAVFNKILAHHDALRMVFEKEKDPILQRNRGVEEKLYDLKIVAVSANDDVEEKIAGFSNRCQSSIDLKKGPLVKIVLFKTGNGGHLLIVIHHLVIDGVSWRILLEDLETGYKQAEKGEEIELPMKTDSYLYWAQKLNVYAGNKDILKEMAYWNEINEMDIDSLPKDYTVNLLQKKVKNNETAAVNFNKEETEKLLKECNYAYSTEINDLLLTALAMALNNWSGIEKTAIDLESHGREDIIEGVDINRTVGWFTTLYPVILDVSKSNDTGYLIKSTKENLRKIPNKGIGCGIVKYLIPENKRKKSVLKLKPEICFNFLGEFGGQRNDGDDGFEISPMHVGDTMSPELEHIYSITIDGMIVNKRMRFIFTFNKYEYLPDNIEKLGSFFKLNLLKIIEYCSKKEEKELTPSDLEYTDMKFEELEEFEVRFDEID